MIPRWIAFYRGPNQRRAGSAFDRELQGSGYADVLWIFVQRWQKSGYVPPQWRHGEPGTSFAAFGPPRSTVRLYYAEHAGQTVLLHVATGKHGRGKRDGSGFRMEPSSMTRTAWSLGASEGESA